MMTLNTIGNLFNHILVAVRNRFRRSLPSSPMEEVSAFYDEHDPQDNVDSSPPEDEFIDLRCMWAVEFYTPAHIDSLISSFGKLGWGMEESASPSQNPINWIRRLGRSQSSTAWMNLGLITPVGAGSSFPGFTRKADLPQSVEYALGGIYALTPSLTCIEVCFVFKEEFSRTFDAALRTDRKTFMTPVGRHWTIHTPHIQKGNNIQEMRSCIVGSIGAWFGNNLPGLFSSGLLGGAIPTCEFVTLRKAEPFPSRTQLEHSSRKYLMLLGMHSDFGAWESTSTTGLKFRMPYQSEGINPYHSILAINESQCIDAVPDYYGSKERSAQIDHLNMVMANLVVMWAILPMIEGYMQQISKVRHSVTFKPRSRQNPIDMLEQLGEHMSYSVAIAAVVSELSTLDNGMPLLGTSGEVFEECYGQVKDRKISLHKQLASVIGKQATLLRATDAALRDHLMQYGSLLGAAENVRVQRRIGSLTRALLLLALASVVMPLVALVLSPGIQGGTSDFWKSWPW